MRVNIQFGRIQIAVRLRIGVVKVKRSAELFLVPGQVSALLNQLLPLQVLEVHLNLHRLQLQFLLAIVLNLLGVRHVEMGVVEIVTGIRGLKYAVVRFCATRSARYDCLAYNSGNNQLK